MKLVIQRVSVASVSVNGQIVSEIGRGALILIGVARSDTAADAEWLAGKVSKLRIYDDPLGRLNHSISEAGGSFLVVSQFTLYGDCAKGNRPSYIEAAEPETAAALYELFAQKLRACGHEVKTGVFREHMDVQLVNDGPVTILMESHGR
ncbi:MAG: D-aminoacyl-tRNA deacylase [Kiritimatiellia bacterium]